MLISDACFSCYFDPEQPGHRLADNDSGGWLNAKGPGGHLGLWWRHRRPSGSVGHHLGSKPHRWIDWRIMAMSLSVALLSSKVPPLSKELRWSYKDLQSLTPILLLRFSTWSTSAKLKGPSTASARNTRLFLRQQKLCASPLRVDETTRGSPYDLRPMQWMGTSWPCEKALEVKANNQPPCVANLLVHHLLHTRFPESEQGCLVWLQAHPRRELGIYWGL